MSQRYHQILFAMCNNSFLMCNICLFSLHLNNISSDEIMDRLFQEYKICSRGGIHCAPLLHQQLHTKNCGLLRFSFSNNNTLDEVKIAIEALKQIMEDV